MIKIVLVFLFLILCLIGSCDELFTGTEWMELSYESKVVYLKGIYDGIMIMQLRARDAKILSAVVELSIFHLTLDSFVFMIDTYYLNTNDLKYPLLKLIYNLEVELNGKT